VLWLTVALGKQQQVAWGEWIIAKGAQAYGVAVLFKKQCAVEHQPHFQWPSEQVAYPFQVAHLGKALLFGALRKACLVESRDTAGYNRCGRTDKGVSAGGQVVSLRLRSRAARRDPPPGWCGGKALLTNIATSLVIRPSPA
jgi:hypothetical protein